MSKELFRFSGKERRKNKTINVEKGVHIRGPTNSISTLLARTQPKQSTFNYEKTS